MRFFVRVAVLLLAPAAAAALVNAVRPHGLKWVATRDELYPPPKAEHLAAAIARDAVKAAYESGEAIILDARTEEQFKNGRIPTAKNFPSHSAVEKQSWLYENIDVSANVIVYCGGKDCEESRQVFDLLKQGGYQNAKLYFGGWQDWTANNMPVEED